MTLNGRVVRGSVSNRKHLIFIIALIVLQSTTTIRLVIKMAVLQLLSNPLLITRIALTKIKTDTPTSNIFDA